MSSNTLPPDTKMGPIHLTISDLERSIAFYRRSIGLTLLERDQGAAIMGAGRRELVHLREEPGALRVPRRTGLYHFALLVPSRHDLGLVLRNLTATNTRLTGGADHLVSEALYLDDPDGNGIEIYRDRPREEWDWENGRLKMDTLPLDYEGILSETRGAADPDFAIHPDTIMGHIHLHVAAIDDAVAFYRDMIGFDLLLRWQESAAFLSAGGYHHHLGANTWAGVGAAPPPEGAVGLRYFQITVPNTAALEALVDRLKAARYPFEPTADGLFVRDPSRNTALVTAA